MSELEQLQSKIAELNLRIMQLVKERDDALDALILANDSKRPLTETHNKP